MKQEGGELRVVAGCLFEVVLPVAGPSSRWRLAVGQPEVTLLDDDQRDGQQRFRFRAETAGAVAGTVELRFESDRAADRSLRVAVAPEDWPGAEPG